MNYINDEYKEDNNLETLYIKVTGDPIVYGNNIQFYGAGKISPVEEWYKLANGNSLQFEFDSSIFGNYFKLYGEYKLLRPL